MDILDKKIEIIKLVEKYDCLYNAHSPRHKHFLYKQHLWNEIGKEVGISGAMAKREFKIIRDGYRKWENKRHVGVGFQNQYKYAEFLGFLDDHMVFRKSGPTKTSASLRGVEINSDISNNLNLQSQTRPDLSVNLIKKVKQHDCLYNIYSPQYNDFEYKEQLWKQFEEELSISANQIKNMWTNLIDRYKKHKQNTHEVFEYADELKFLDDYIIPESEPGNETFVISFIDDDEVSLDSSNSLDLSVDIKTEDIKIIKAIESYDCLYNAYSPKYRDVEYKKELWNQIGEEVGLSGEGVKTRWKAMKGCYGKSRLQIDTKYKYSKYLTFFDDYIAFRSKVINEAPSLIDEEIATESISDVELLDHNLYLHVQIIEAVKKNKCLYDASTPQYKNFEYKQEIWNQIGVEVGLPSKTVRNKWQYIRHHYIRYKQNRTKSNKYAAYLKFLDGYISTPSYEEFCTDLHLKVIEEVKNYKCLYDPQSIRCNDFEYRQQLWYKIGTKLGISAKNVKGKWKHIKAGYKRYKQIPNTNYKYAENLKFLDDYIFMESKGFHVSKSPNLSNGLNVKNLINVVKKYDCLYNEQSPKYKDYKYKQKIWNKVGKEIGKPKNEVKKKWSSLLHRYKKCKEGGFPKQFKYMEYMKFMDDIVFNSVDQNSSQLSVDIEESTDLSSDTDIYNPPVEKPISTNSFREDSKSFENFNNKSCPSEIENVLEKPLSIKKENTIADETSQWFEKVNFENSLEEMENFSEEPISTNNLGKIENSKICSNKWFEKLNFENSLEEIQDFPENPLSFKKENTKSQRCEKENVEKQLEEKEDISEEPISSKNLNKIENAKGSTSQWFELLAKKINESNITAEQKNEIEYAVSSIVYSKLAEYSKQS